jgi:hypothetical protein
LIKKTKVTPSGLLRKEAQTSKQTLPCISFDTLFHTTVLFLALKRLVCIIYNSFPQVLNGVRATVGSVGQRKLACRKHAPTRVFARQAR